MFKFDIGAAELGEFLERQQDQITVRQRHGFRRIALGMDAIDTEEIAFHREAQHLLITEFVDQHRLQETGVDDEQGVEGLAYRMYALPRLELHVLEQELFIVDRRCGGDAEQVAEFFQV
jgi:hypothetical protein